MNKIHVKPWKVAVVVSSLTLGGAFVAYAKWNVGPRPAETRSVETQRPDAPSAETPPAEALEPEVFLPGSKAPIGIGGGSGGAFKGRGAATSPAAEAPKELDPAIHMGGSKSMPLPPPGGTGPSR